MNFAVYLQHRDTNQRRQSSKLNTRILIHYEDDGDRELNGRVVAEAKKSIAMGKRIEMA